MFSKGRWVKFWPGPGEFAGAHRSRDGQVVGILTGAGRDSLTGKPTPARINVVTKDQGHNLVELHEGQARNVVLDPDAIQWQLADVPADCPIDRVAHLVKGA